MCVCVCVCVCVDVYFPQCIRTVLRLWHESTEKSMDEWTDRKINIIELMMDGDLDKCIDP